jgi:wyosine [tRNA(Phe)-imidazoG37] synthetase (radical SAM superfamily)
MKKFNVNVKVPVQVTWTPELVEDKENFYLRLWPHINTSGVKGAPRLQRVTDGNVTRIMMVKHVNYNEKALYEALEKAKKVAKEDPELKKAIIAGAQGKNVSPKPAPQLSRLSSIHVSEEDKALGMGVGREDYGQDMRSTGWSKKQLEEITKEE